MSRDDGKTWEHFFESQGKIESFSSFENLIVCSITLNGEAVLNISKDYGRSWSTPAPARISASARLYRVQN